MEIENKKLKNDDYFDFIQSSFFRYNSHRYNTIGHRGSGGRGEVTKLNTELSCPFFGKRTHIYRAIQKDYGGIYIDYFPSKLNLESVFKTHKHHYGFLGSPYPKIIYNEIPKVRMVIPNMHITKDIEDYLPSKKDIEKYIEFKEHSVNVLWDEGLWENAPFLSETMNKVNGLMKKIRKNEDIYDVKPLDLRMRAGSSHSIYYF